jgi:hypothetical protein
MGCTTRLVDSPRCIEVRYFGTVTADDVATGLRDGFELAVENDLWSILTDTSELTSDPSVFALYDVATQLSDAGVARRYREALVAPPGADSLETARFYEDAMVNRGLLARVFASRAEAEAWLHEQDRGLRA